MLIQQSYPNLLLLQENLNNRYLSNLSKGRVTLLLEIERLSKLFSEVFPSRKTLAGVCGVKNVATITRWTDELVEKGFLIKWQPEGMPFETNRHILTPWLKENIDRLYNVYKRLKKVFLDIALLVSAKMATEPDVTLYSYLTEKDLSKTGPDRKHVYAGTPARDKVTASKEDCSKNVSKRKESKYMELPDIPEYIQVATKMLGLTLTGQLKLMSFTQPTVEYGLEQIKHMKGSKDVYKQLMEVCKQFSTENNQFVDWQPYLRLAEANPDKLNKLGPFISAKVRSIPAQNTGANHKPYVPNPDLMKNEQIRMRGIQKAWEAKKSAEELEQRKQEGREILQALNVKSPNSLTDQQERSVQTKRETIAKLEAIGNLDPIRQILLDTWKQELKELEAEYEPKWPQDVQEDIDWFKQYVSTMTVTKHSYKPILDRIEQGPTGPWAVTGQLQQGLRWARLEVSTEPKVSIDSPAKEEPVELIDEDQAFDEV